MSEMIQIGSIRKPHGLKGELKVQVDERFLRAFLSVGVVFLEQSGQFLPYFIAEVKGEKGDIIRLEDVDTRQAAEALNGTPLFLKEEAVGTVETHLYETWKGFEVLDGEGTVIGIIAKVVEYPQQWMAFVQTDAGKEIMIPLIDPFITKVNKEGKKLEMELPEGLLDL